MGRRLTILMCCFAVLPVLGARPAQAACTRSADPELEETLFTFNALIYAATSVASANDFEQLRQFLLVYQPDDAIDRALPVRLGVADAVQSWPMSLRQRALQYFLSHKAAATNFNALVLQLVGPAPQFQPYDQEVPGGESEQVIFNHRAKLANLMREAYRQGRVHELWTHWSPYWAQAQICPEHLTQVQHSVTAYARLPDQTLLGNSVVIKNPLMPFGSGVTCVYSDGHFVMLIGPTHTTRDEDLLIAHELTHPLLNTLFRNDRRLRLALSESECVFDSIRHDSQSGVLTRYVYNTWESYFSESLVRSLSHHVVGITDPGVGFTLASFLDQQLTHYEAQSTSFTDTALRTLEALRRDYCYGPPQVSHVTASAHRRQRFFRQ